MRLLTQIVELYQPLINGLSTFQAVLDLDQYLKFIQSNKQLSDLIEREHEDLRKTKRSLPKAKTAAEYKMMVRILLEKLFTNISEDYMELFFVQEALNNLKNRTPFEDLADIDQLMVKDLQKLKDGRIEKDNYYLNKDWSRYLQKVQRYLSDQLIEDKSVGISFVSESGTLFVNGIPVKIKAQRTVTNQYRIVNYIFSQPDLRDDFFYREIADAIADDDFKTSRYTTAFEKIKEKICKATGINDVFIFDYSGNQGKVKINPKYLP